MNKIVGYSIVEVVDVDEYFAVGGDFVFGRLVGDGDVELMSFCEVVYDFVDLFRGVFEVLAHFMQALFDVFMDSRYFTQIVLGAQHVVTNLVGERDGEVAGLAFNAVDAFDEAHRIVVFFHLLYFFEGEGEKVLKDRRSSHFVALS